MIVSVKELRQHIDTALEDVVLEDKLLALELLVRKYTNNNFQKRNIRYECVMRMAQKLYIPERNFKGRGHCTNFRDTV